MKLTHKVHPFSRGALRRRTPVLFMAAMLLSSNLLQQVQAAASGKLDRSFGGGRVELNVSRGSDSVADVAIQTDGRVVAAGSVGGGLPGGSDFGLARYEADGSLDTSFGHSGKVITSFFGVSDSAAAVAIQADGRIVAAGSTSTSKAFESLDIALARYNIDGTPDASFGVGGKVTTDFFGNQDFASAIGMRPDGRIVVAGAAIDSTAVYQSFAVVQYNMDGSLDTTFGIGGKATTRFTGLGGSGSGNGYAHDLAIQPDGSIVVVGAADVFHFDFGLVRFLSYGSLDTSFGMGGKVVTDFFNRSDSGNSIAIQSDGRLVVGGYVMTSSDPTSFDFALARYNTNGSLDSTFGAGGKVTTDLRGYSDQAGDLAIQADGGIVLAGGSSLTSDYSTNDFALTRYHTDGNLDSGFGISGIAITDFNGFNDHANAIAIQQDGRIVAAGSSYISNTDIGFALARYR
jgi:uncharacterized delta-60 repeat protein